ncbi:MAG: hypothetical protein AABY22_35250, partial [Nanoarchaeota archaeon]
MSNYSGDIKSNLNDTLTLKILSYSLDIRYGEPQILNCTFACIGNIELIHKSIRQPILIKLEPKIEEEFQKIEANFLRNAKQYFGGRISNYEVEQFLKTIPSLSQSP